MHCTEDFISLEALKYPVRFTSAQFLSLLQQGHAQAGMLWKVKGDAMRHNLKQPVLLRKKVKIKLENLK